MRRKRRSWCSEAALVLASNGRSRVELPKDFLTFAASWRDWSHRSHFPAGSSKLRNGARPRPRPHLRSAVEQHLLLLLGDRGISTRRRASRPRLDYRNKGRQLCFLDDRRRRAGGCMARACKAPDGTELGLVSSMAAPINGVGKVGPARQTTGHLSNGSRGPPLLRLGEEKLDHVPVLVVD